MINEWVVRLFQPAHLTTESVQSCSERLNVPPLALCTPLLLASDWPREITWPGYWPLISPTPHDCPQVCHWVIQEEDPCVWGILTLVIFILVYPVHCHGLSLTSKSITNNICQALTGTLTWTGYSLHDKLHDTLHDSLPELYVMATISILTRLTFRKAFVNSLILKRDIMYKQWM